MRALRLSDFSQQRRAEGCLSDLMLDRLLAGEPVGASVEAHVAGCTECTARLGELRHERALDMPLVDELRLRPARVLPLPRRRWLIAAPIFAAAAVLLLLLLPRFRPLPSERAKGSPTALVLDVVVRHGDGTVEALAPGKRVRAGDAVRFVVSTARPGHLVILGLDAAGKVSVYVADGANPHPIVRGAHQPMPGSIILDDTPGAERLVALECDARFPVADAVDAGRRQLDRAARDPRRVGALGLPGCAEATLTMDKSE
ncbi:MAG: hypothetical protein ACXVDD_21680 [Polyangia bacterium]